jgi:hypothetical protein
MEGRACQASIGEDGPNLVVVALGGVDRIETGQSATRTGAHPPKTIELFDILFLFGELSTQLDSPTLLPEWIHRTPKTPFLITLRYRTL